MTAAGAVRWWRGTSEGLRALLVRAVSDLDRWVGRPWQQRGTQTYLTVLAVTSLWTVTASDRLASAALRHASTNLDGLARNPVAVLVSSAMWMEPGGWWSYLSLAGVAVLVLAPFERRLGTGRWLTAFVAGHIGATLLTALGLRIGLAAGRLDGSLAGVVDVGWSYGAFAVAASGSWVLPRTVGWCWAAAVVAWCVLAEVRQPTFTAVGHMLAAAIGLAIGPALARTAP